MRFVGIHYYLNCLQEPMIEGLLLKCGGIYNVYKLYVIQLKRWCWNALAFTYLYRSKGYEQLLSSEI